MSIAPQMLSPSAQNVWNNAYSNTVAPSPLNAASQDAYRANAAMNAVNMGPIPPVTPSTNNISSSSSASTAPTQAQLAEPLAQLSQLDQILANRNNASQQEYNTNVASYKAQDATDQRNLQDNTQQNEQTYTKNEHAGLLNAANASTGLRQVLASMGALGGSGMDVVNHLVGLAQNSDAGNARNAFDTNAKTLQGDAQTMDLAEKKRMADAQSLLHNNEQNNQADVLTSRQSILDRLATLFGPHTAQGDSYATQAAALAAPIANTTVKSVAPYAAASSLYSPAALQQYLAGTQALNVNTSGGTPSTPAQTPINSPAYNPAQKKVSMAGVA